MQLFLVSSRRLFLTRIIGILIAKQVSSLAIRYIRCSHKHCSAPVLVSVMVCFVVMFSRRISTHQFPVSIHVFVSCIAAFVVLPSLIY